MTRREIEPTRVLLVEDSPTDAELVLAKLNSTRSIRCDVTHVTRRDPEIMAFATRHFDVVLLDLTLPDSTGIETVAAMLRAVPNAAILVMSGHSDIGIARDAVRLGAEGFFSKSAALSAADLESHVSQAIERKSRERSQRSTRQETAALRSGRHVSHAFKKPVDDIETGLYQLLAYITSNAPAHADAVSQIIERTYMRASIHEMRAVMDAAEKRTRSTTPPSNDMAMLKSSPDIPPTPALSKRRLGAALNEWPDDWKK